MVSPVFQAMYAASLFELLCCVDGQALVGFGVRVGGGQRGKIQNKGCGNMKVRIAARVCWMIALVAVLGGVVFCFCRGLQSGLNALVALGTLIVAFVAVSVDWIRATLIPPRLKLEIQPPTLTEVRNAATQENLGMAWYFSLEVRNLRRWRKATNCRVVLKAIHRPRENGTLQAEPMSIPLPFQWAVVPAAPLYLTVSSEGAVVNFGKLWERKPFEPVLVSRTLNFRHTLEPNETALYTIQIQADDLISEDCQVIKVSWDGEWSDKVEEIIKHVRISEESPQKPEA